MRPPALSRTVEAILIGTAYVLPLAVLPLLIQDASGLPKTVALAFSTALLCGAGLARVFVYRDSLSPATPLLSPLLVLMAVAALSAISSPAPAASVSGLLYLGALVLATLCAASLPVRDRLANAIMIAAGLTALYGIAQFMGFEPVQWSSHFKPRVFATLGNPVFLGGFLAAVFPLVFSRWLYAEREETKDLLVLLLAVLAAAVYLTWTRSAWLAVLASTAAQLALLGITAPGRRLLSANRAWLLTAAVLALVAVTLISSVRMFGRTPVPLADRIRDALNPAAYSVQFRRLTTEVCLRLGAARPILGAGINGYRAEYPFLRLKTAAARAAPERYFASQERNAHNDHLQVLAELGVTGFGVWIWLLACASRWAWARYRSPGEGPLEDAWLPLGALGCLTAMCVDGSLNFPLHIAPTAWVFFVCLGLLGAGRAAGCGAPLFQAPWLRGVTAGALVIVCAAAVVRPAASALKADKMLMEGDRQVSYNNYEMADAYYQMGVEASPLNEFLRFRHSVAAVRAGRWEWQGEALDRGLAHARAALALGYHDENVYKHISDIYGRKTSIPKAIEALRLANALNPLREDIANNLAFYMTERGEDLSEALRLARGAVKAAPEDPTYLDTLGYILLKAGKPREALPVLNKALRGLPAGSADPRHAAARSEILEHIRLARAAAASK